MEKDGLVEFVAKVMEESGFKVYKGFKTSRYIIDIYGILSTVLGDIGVVVACKDYNEKWKVGLDVLKEVEMMAKTLRASKVVVVTTSSFTENAINYAGRRNIKLIDREGLMNLGKLFSDRSMQTDIIVEAEEYTPKPESKKRTMFLRHKKRNLLLRGKKKEISAMIKPKIKGLLGSVITIVAIVLLISSTIAYVIESLKKATMAELGIIKIFFSMLLSYGLVFMVDRDMIMTLVKGSTVFFISLLVYVILAIIW